MKKVAAAKPLFVLTGIMFLFLVFYLQQSALAVPVQSCIETAGKQICITDDTSKSYVTVETSDLLHPNDPSGIKGIWHYNTRPEENNNQGGGNLYELYFKETDPDALRNLVAYANWPTPNNSPGAFTGIGGVGSTEMYVRSSVLNMYAYDGTKDWITDKVFSKEPQTEPYACFDTEPNCVENDGSGDVYLKFTYKVKSQKNPDDTTVNNKIYFPAPYDVNNQYWYQIEKIWKIEPSGSIHLTLNWSLLNSGYASEIATRSQWSYEGEWTRFVKYAHSSSLPNHDPQNQNQHIGPNSLYGSSDMNREVAQCWNYLNRYHADWFSLTGSDVAPTVRITADNEGGFDGSGLYQMGTNVLPANEGAGTMEQCSCLGPAIGGHGIGWFSWWGGNPPPGWRYWWVDAAQNSSWTDHLRIDLISHSPVLDESGANVYGPEITSVQTEEQPDGSVIVSWNTDLDSNSVVEGTVTPEGSSNWQDWNRTAQYPNRPLVEIQANEFSEQQQPYPWRHSARVSGLTDETAYTFRVKSTDTSGREAVSSGHRLTVHASGYQPDLPLDFRASTSSLGKEANFRSEIRPSISQDGRYVAFASKANNLAPEDGDYVKDIYLKDILTGTISLVSTSTAGVKADKDSDHPFVTVSPDNGDIFVAFTSDAKLVADDNTNDCATYCSDVYVKNMTTGEIVLASRSASGQQGLGASNRPSLSVNGRYVAFVSDASNLVTGDTGKRDVFVKDTQYGDIVRASTSSSGAQANAASAGKPESVLMPPSISANGQKVVFESDASNLVTNDGAGTDVFLKEISTANDVLVAGNTIAVTAEPSYTGFASLSADGNHAVFEAHGQIVPEVPDTNGVGDIYVKNLQDGTFQRVSTKADGSQASGWAWYSGISADGRYVTFAHPSDLITYEPSTVLSIYVRDMQDNSSSGLKRVTPKAASALGSGGRSYWPVISSNGQYIAFDSSVPSLVANDANGTWDIFVGPNFNDNTVPTINNLAPNGIINISETNIAASFADSETGIDPSTVEVKLDNNKMLGCTVTGSGVSCPSGMLVEGAHYISVSVRNNMGMEKTLSGEIIVDTIAPMITDLLPSGNLPSPMATISAQLSDSVSGMNIESETVTLDGQPISNCDRQASSITCEIVGFSGLENGHQIELSVTDNAGNISTATSQFNITRPHTDRTTSIIINDSGGNCNEVGVWNQATKTCTLSTDITITSSNNGIYINTSGVTFDGAGFSIDSTGPNYPTGVGSLMQNGLTIKNLEVRSFQYGIYMGGGSSNITIRNNLVKDNNNGVYIDNSSNVSIFNNSLVNNASQVVVSGGSSISLSQAAPVGGNYWSSFDEVTEGCINENSDNFCDGPYNVSTWIDALPWASKIGWT
ncbi:MAG: NosD domain-containing protein [Thermoleophilia bacterium]